MGRQRLPAHLRRLPAAGRAAGRPLRPATHVPDRDRPLHGRVAGVRARRHPGPAGRSARRPGLRRRAGVGRRPVADHDPVHRARRAREGDGDLRVRAFGRRHRRGAAGRGAHRPALVALDLPREHPGRGRRLPALAAAAAHRAGRGRGRPPGRLGRRHRDGRPDAGRLRDRQRQRGRLGLGAHPRPAGRRRRHADRVPGHRVARDLAAGAARPLPHPQRRERERRRRADGGRPVRLVLLLGPLPAADPRLHAAGGGARLPALDDHLGRLLADLRPDRDALRHHGAAGRRARADGPWPAALRPHAGGREPGPRRHPGHDRRSASAPASPSTPSCSRP